MLRNWLLLRLLPDAPHVLARRITTDASRLTNGLSVLDIGGGSGALWREVERLIDGRCSLKVVILDGADLSSTEDAKNWKRITGLLPDALDSFEDASFDFVTAFEVIEHLPKHDGYAMLYEMERIARLGFGVSTPNKFMWQPPSPNNKFNSHVSGWRWGDFRRFGMEAIFLHSSSRIVWLILVLARVLKFSRILSNLEIANGLSAWRWSLRTRADQPLISTVSKIKN
jgi:SAM-dependent methyltransferase